MKIRPKFRWLLGDALSRVEVEEGEEIYIVSADLKDAFYHLGLPEELRKYFALRPVYAKDVGVQVLHGKKIHLMLSCFRRVV